MREGWSYKKLGEVCKIVGGSTPKTNIAEYWEGYNMWVTPAELNGEKYFHHTERTISDAAVKSAHLQLLPVGTVLLSSRAPIGKVAITTSPMYCNQGFKNAICSDAVKNDYVYWYLLYSKESLQALGTGATFKEISKKTVSEFSIPVPPLTTQHQIVSELDLLSHILDQKRQQLKEYDALAESIFYDMFGDPVENPKGWEICSLDSITEVRDGTHDSPKYLEHSDYILITSKNIVNGEISFENINYISEEDYNNINKRSFVETGDIIMAMIGTIGNPIIVKRDRNFCVKNVAIIKFGNATTVHNSYIKALLDNASYFKYLTSLNKGGTQKFVALGTLRKLPIPLPPLSLQRSFAAKIESIEHQKQLLRASIKETEMLFQSRMDYWFNG